MKQLSLLFTCMFAVLLTFSMTAQDPKKDFKEASKALGTFNLNPSENEGKLEEAATLIESVLKTPDYRNDPDAWNLAGDIYSKMAEEDSKMVILKPAEARIKYQGAGVKAFNAYQTGLEKAEKKNDQKDALKGMSQLAGHLSNIGNHYINATDYANAFEPLNAVYKIDKILVKNEMSSLFNTEEDKMNHLFAVGACAMRAGENARAKEIFMMMDESGATDPRIYSNLFNMLVEEDEAKAMEYLRKGQEIDPENIDLLYAEINYLIKKQDFEALEKKLKLAIEKSPENPSVYLALGNVYSQLASKAYAEEDIETAEQYDKEAIRYFEQVLELDPKSFDALYSIGSIHFNKGASYTQQMAELGLSKEEQEKYEQLDKEVHRLFDLALPYFQKSEVINPNDRNTLIALKEIYARMNEFEMSNEFKDRLERVVNGETNSSSYFENE